MANRRYDPVSYRPFRVKPLLSEGLLPVDRPGGEFMERVAAGLFRMADEAGQVADRKAAAQGARAGQRAALDGRPGAEVTGGGAGAFVEGGDHRTMAANILRKEEGFRSTPYWDVNALRTGYGSDTITRADGSVVKVEKGMTVSRDDADRDLSRRLGEFESRAAGQTGSENWNRLPPAARAALLSVTYNYGSLPKSVVNAVRSGDQNAVANAVDGLSANKTRRRREASMIRGSSGSSIDTSRPILENADGSFSTEETITVDIDRGGKKVWVNLPTIVDGKRVGEEEAVKQFKAGTNNAVGEFATLKEAETAARARSEEIGRVRQGDRTAGVTLTGGGFRPSGSDTIRGRAYDEAGTRTYVQLVEAEMRSTTSQLFEQHRDNPAELEKAFGELKGALRKDHIFEEIEADFEVGFGNMSERYLGQARENYARKVEAQDRAAFIERTSTLETDQQRRLADFDPLSPDAADAIASSQAAIDDHYDAAVDRGILDPDDAARAKIASRREAALGYYGKQAEALDADGVKAMRAEIEADFAAGGVEGLDGEGYASLTSGLEKLEKTKRLEATRATDEFRTRGDQMAARLAAGYELDQAELSKLMLDSGATPQGKAALQETFAKISAGRAIRDMSVAQGTAHVAGLKKQYGAAPTDGELRTLAFAAGMLEAKKTAIATDSVSYAEAQGIVPATPLLTDAQTAEDMIGIMTARTAAAETAASELNTSTRYLKAGEAKALADAVKKNPAAGVGIAGAIVSGAGDAAVAVLAEFGNDAPMISEAGAIIAFGGSARAAEDVILGYGKGPDGKQTLKGLKPDAARESFRAVTGGALAMAGQDAQRIDRAAASIARKRISEEGLDPASEEALAVHATAVQEAAGAVYDRGVQFGGFAEVDRPGLFTGSAKVLVPSTIRAEAFGDVLASITDEDLAGLKVKPKAGLAAFGLFGGDRLQRSPAATLRDAAPVAVDGGFAFALGDPGSEDPQFIMGDDGQAFVLDILSLRDRLAPRNPGAFR